MARAKKMSFGERVALAREELEWTQRDLAEEIRREDGASISPQYLHDIEHDRRQPSSDHLIKQFARVLDIDPHYLFYLAGKIPDDIRKANLPEDKVVRAFQNFKRFKK